MNVMVRVALCLFMGVSGLACQGQPEQSPPTQAPPTPAQVSPEHIAAYKPGPNPLAALYGSAQKKDGREGFQLIKHQPPQAPMPQAWRRAYGTLERSALSVKLSAWSSTERSRLDQARADYTVRWTLHVLGKRGAIKAQLHKALAPVTNFSSLRPEELGAQLSHRGARDAYHLSVELKTLWTEGEVAHIEVEVEWARRAPKPSGELRNCRYLKGLTSPSDSERAPWLNAIFKSNSKRRFAEWSYQVGAQDAPRWTGLWVYRNGSLRDKGVRWWSDTITAQGGERVEMSGMEQRWRLPSGAELLWWSETNPEELGCTLEAPLLAVSWSD